MNAALASQTVGRLMSRGVAEFCLCPGARNSPLIDLLLDVPDIRRWRFFEERSAAFFALGRMKATGRPVAVVTTSGTAAGELLPAAMEAHYSGLPLVLLTADRPRRFRGSGAPQTAEQVGLFGPYTEATLDLAGDERLELSSWSATRPLHVNVCFEEPLLDAHARDVEARDFVVGPPPSPSSLDASTLEDMRSSIEAFLARSKHPLFVVGSLAPRERAGTLRFLSRFQAPTYFEAHSGLREERALTDIRVHCPDGILSRARAAGYPIDAVLRIGGVPTLRLWRDLEALGGKLPVLSVGSEPFPGLSWGKIVRGSPAVILESVSADPPSGMEVFLREDHAVQEKLRSLLHSEPLSEPALVHSLSRAIPPGARLFLGNSLPIREWDLAATFVSRGYEITASRGLNGIDGQVSAFYGFSEPEAENWALLGDLTALYDLAAPWVLDQLGSRVKTSLVVLNNGGGRIFSRMFGRPEFQNPHALDFEAWARLWKIRYERWDAIPDSGWATREHRIIELRPDESASARFWDSYSSICEQRS